MKRSAFTLAEVLITLAIIGVVAALTIPTLMANYQKVQYVAALKKAYSEMNQAITLMANDLGCQGDLNCTKLFDADTPDDAFNNEFVKYFKIAKNCKNADYDGTLGCFPDTINNDYDGIEDGISSGWDSSGYRFITADGFSIKAFSGGNGCDNNDYSTHATNDMTQVCGMIYLDVNGLKGPNYMGRDIFIFWITNGKGPQLYPNGGADYKWNSHWANDDGTPRSCYPDDTAGNYCAGRIMEEGWQMNY